MSENNNYGIAIIIGFLIIGMAILFQFSSVKLVYDTSLPKESDGSVAVAIQDQFTEIVDLRLTKKIVDVNLTQNYSIGDYYINISTSNNVTPALDDLVCLKEQTAFYQGEVLSVTFLGGNNYEIRLDKPLDYAFTTLGGCSLREDNWAVDGSVTPQTFSVSPSKLNNDTKWDITRIILICLGDGVAGGDPTPDMSSFFTTDPITNGIVLRSTNGVTKNIFNAKDNFHLASETYDIAFTDANRFGLYSVYSRRSFNGQDKNGVTIRLTAQTNDRFELIIQDDLTDMTECHAVAQGHVVEN